MNIQANGIRNIDNERQVVFFTLTDDTPEVYLWHSNTPVLEGQNLQNYLDDKLNDYLLLIRKREYPGAIYQDSVGDTDLEKFTQWIADGHTNPSGVIDKVPFTASWSIKRVTAENDMKDSVFYNKTEQQIGDYIDANWTDLTDSKATFKKLCKEVRDVILRQGWED